MTVTDDTVGVHATITDDVRAALEAVKQRSDLRVTSAGAGSANRDGACFMFADAIRRVSVRQAPDEQFIDV